ncbi:hypothetical protein P8452_52502 [Trifolium repens]|nr:hypothetical protein P8452_52502 [Trifolium repens]
MDTGQEAESKLVMAWFLVPSVSSVIDGLHQDCRSGDIVKAVAKRDVPLLPASLVSLHHMSVVSRIQEMRLFLEQLGRAAIICQS